MENARLLDEKLKKIIREVSLETGKKIQLDLLVQFEKEVEHIVRWEIAGVLKAIRHSLNDI